MSRRSAAVFRLYDYARSGNCYKVRLLLTQLGHAFERIEVDVLAGATRAADFAAKNPQRKVPVLEWPDGRRLAESNAILCHLARGTPFLPADEWSRALVLQWLFFEQNMHEPTIAVARFWHISGSVEKNRTALNELMRRGQRILGLMEDHLAERSFFVAERYSIADIALYAYTHVADEGGFDLDGYPRIRAWMARVAAQARHVRITD